MRRKAKHQEDMQAEYAKIKNRLKNMDIELHTEVRASLCCCQELQLQQVVQLVYMQALLHMTVCERTWLVQVRHTSHEHPMDKNSIASILQTFHIAGKI